MILAHAVPPFAARGLSGYMDEEDGLVTKVGTSRILEQYEGSTISLYGCGASGAYALGPEEEEECDFIWQL